MKPIDRDTIFAQFARGEVTAAEVARVTGVEERRIVEWIRARRNGFPRPRPKPVTRTPRVEQAVSLYKERYRGRSVVDFQRTLRDEHGMILAASTLRDALRAEGLLPSPPASRPLKISSVAVRHTPVTTARTRPPSSTREVVPPPDPFDTEDPQRPLVATIQIWSDMTARLNSTVRDRIVAWRRGQVPIDAVVDAFASLRAFILGLPPV